MKLEDLYEEQEEWRNLRSKIGGLLHSIGVNASYPRNNGIVKIQSLMWPDWKVEELGGEEGIKQLLSQLQQEGLVIVDFENGTVRKNPEHPYHQAYDRQNRSMSAAAARDPNFTRGT